MRRRRRDGAVVHAAVYSIGPWPPPIPDRCSRTRRCALLLERLSPLPAETLALTSALTGRVVAADVHAAHDLPPFDNSAMDGYAVRAADAAGELLVAGGSFAGDDPARLEPHTAMTIATGAPLPAGADSVVPVERAHVDGDRVSFDGACRARRPRAPAGHRRAAPVPS